MGYGALSAAILAAAGEEIQVELNSKLVMSTDSVTAGDIIVTAGYNLKCLFVLHIVGLQFGDAVGLKVSIYCLSVNPLGKQSD
jgi:O-acetyl-ADP-ribose deacetylase (regulator of RNase III)